MDDKQLQRALTFQALHRRDELLVLPNPWDAGSAKILAALGFEALATTSAGLAFTLGRPDGEGLISREETLDNARAIVAATPLPVAADLENGFADEPQGCADTLLQAAACGLVGGSIEDASGRADAPIYPMELAVERIRASVAAARSLPFPFTLCARAENFLHGREDLSDTLHRLEAYAEAGADVLYAPGLTTRAQIDAVVRAVAPKPVNVLMGLSASPLTLDELAALGVRRVSVGSSLARAAFGGFLRAARELRQGSTDFARDAAPFAELNDMFTR
ncbi:isocitrate lyase/PEP mutase family protein [Ectopseudomonas alcaliphila]|uniref:2-Methylisocitrate lyase, PEP mutase family n=1 Tax=Ectopseudomonas alcaliphila TaxID=101564 RepID=A0A1G6V772_9GAMM|nr:isocitrate lyase/phosphoenolpyruvate mutase family protein [Pseudomonas alcaliphila]MDX5991718.1 isocitrate lyase/phosphoenolpyruvate mutase family protein [Pseudomonas alcaliphila]SDD49381.1 2-Methylisocitrate lyase, PEP mutase family [Pseudomonas alcaliphila]